MAAAIEATGVPITAAQARYLIATAARAPSVHNTQPWRFRVAADAIELYSDSSRKLLVDAIGREMMISCGAAVFGLRLAVRSLGYLPAARLFPEPDQPRLVARVALGPAGPMTVIERHMAEAVPHRHTHRGAFEPVTLPAGLLAGLQHDAKAEGATLALVHDGRAYEQLAAIADAASRALDQHAVAGADVRRWSRELGSKATDGVPASAFPSRQPGHGGPLAQRDFDRGRGIGRLPPGQGRPAATAILLTAGDERADWLRAGQALYRLLLRAASRWVFASLYTQPLELPAIRSLIQSRLALPGRPQVLLQLGVSRTTLATARRDPAELTDP